MYTMVAVNCHERRLYQTWQQHEKNVNPSAWLNGEELIVSAKLENYGLGGATRVF